MQHFVQLLYGLQSLCGLDTRTFGGRNKKKKTRNNITFGGKSANLVSGFYELKKSSKRLCKGFYRWIKGSNNRKETVVLSKSWK